MSHERIKESKVALLKRLIDIEEKYKTKGYISSFKTHETNLTASNIAIWKMAQRGILTPEDVRIAIYQLADVGLVDIVNSTNLRLTDKGRDVAVKIRSMVPASVPDELLGVVKTTVEQPAPKKTNKCIDCGLENAESANFCASCGAPLKKATSNICSSCQMELTPGTRFCPHCGQKV